jgi:hypothetical protein
MKTCCGNGGIAPRILNHGTSWRWVVSFMPRPLYPRGKSPQYPLVGWLGGSRAGLDAGHLNVKIMYYALMVIYVARIFNLKFSPGDSHKNRITNWCWQISWGETKTNGSIMLVRNSVSLDFLFDFNVLSYISLDMKFKNVPLLIHLTQWHIVFFSWRKWNVLRTKLSTTVVDISCWFLK